jgi:hypothetical protein
VNLASGRGASELGDHLSRRRRASAVASFDVHACPACAMPDVDALPRRRTSAPRQDARRSTRTGPAARAGAGPAGRPSWMRA